MSEQLVLGLLIAVTLLIVLLALLIEEPSGAAADTSVGSDAGTLSHEVSDQLTPTADVDFDGYPVDRGQGVPQIDEPYRDEVPGIPHPEGAPPDDARRAAGVPPAPDR